MKSGEDKNALSARCESVEDKNALKDKNVGSELQAYQRQERFECVGRWYFCGLLQATCNLAQFRKRYQRRALRKR